MSILFTALEQEVLLEEEERLEVLLVESWLVVCRLVKVACLPMTGGSWAGCTMELGLPEELHSLATLL